MTTKRCSTCGEAKLLTEFHRQPSGTHGRHCYCKPCAGLYYNGRMKRNYSSDQKRRWSLHTRYRITVAGVDALYEKQAGACGLCSKELHGKYHIDHDHSTRKVRGLLCHRCNILIGGLDDPGFRAKAVAWLERGR